MTSLAALTATTPDLPCRTTDPEIFFSLSSTDRAIAIALCTECPLRVPCAQYALDHPDLRGVWGGTTAADRRSFQTGRPWQFDEQGRLRLACGSEEAYRAHFGYREQPCEPCVAAHEAHIEGERRARLAVEHEAGGSARGWWIHRRLGEPPCRMCVAVYLAQQSKKRQERSRRGLQRARSGPAPLPASDPLRAPQTPAQRLPLTA